MMQLRSQRSKDISLDLTALIDVVFLLLLFFMVSTRFSEESYLDIQLPEAPIEEYQAMDKNKIIVVINSDGEYLINDQPLTSQTLENLKEALRVLIKDQENPSLVIAGDAQAPHQAVVTALSAANHLGIKSLDIVLKDSSSSNS